MKFLPADVSLLF